MSNAFAILGLPKVAALDPDTLQKAWLNASRSAHPDQPGGDVGVAADINAAYETLLSPEKRIKHLLELYEVPWRAVAIDQAMMEVFGRVGTLLQSAATLQKRKAAATSSLAKALLAPQEMHLRESLEEVGTEIEKQRELLIEALPELDQKLAVGDASAPHSLQSLQARLAYLAKWQTQIREALLAIM